MRDVAIMTKLLRTVYETKSNLVGEQFWHSTWNIYHCNKIELWNEPCTSVFNQTSSRPRTFNLNSRKNNETSWGRIVLLAINNSAWWRDEKNHENSDFI